jgi:predicted alpha/beta hydrolase family esterase
LVNAFIIHGSGGNPESNWFPWLKEQLESLGVKTYVPEFPIGKQQTLQNWLSKLRERVRKLAR